MKIIVELCLFRVHVNRRMLGKCRSGLRLMGKIEWRGGKELEWIKSRMFLH